MSQPVYRDVNIEIRLRFAGRDWHANHLEERDVIAEIRDAIDDVLKIQRYQSIKIYLDKEGKYGKEEY